MNAYQKIFQIISILLIVCGIVEVLVAGLFGFVGAILSSADATNQYIAQAGIENPVDQKELLDAEAQVEGLGPEAITELLVIASAVGLDGVLSVAAGIVGLVALRRPRRMNVFLVLNAILLCLGALGLVNMTIRGAVDTSLLTFMLIPVLLQVLAFTCAVNIKFAVSDGTIAEDWYDAYHEDRKAGGAHESLGFIRVIQVFFALCIIGSLFLCMILVSGSYEVDASFVVYFVNVVGQGVAFWLILKRFRIARWWVIGVSTFNIVVGTAGVIVAGDFSLTERLVSCSFDIALILYFALSKKVRRVLTIELNAEQQKKELIEAWDLWKPKTWDFWRSMIIYYCLFSIVGHWMEACYCLSIKYGIMPGIYDPTSGIWRDYLNPFPVYGIGMVACALMLYPIKTMLQDKFGGVIKPLIGSFIVNTIVVAIIELAMGLACNADLSLWDYSNMFCNFMGQICLLNSSLFGLVATLMTWVVFPALQKLYLRLPLDVKKTLFVGILVFYAVVICLYVINLPIAGSTGVS